jgi:RecA-family ATPase
MTDDSGLSCNKAKQREYKMLGCTGEPSATPDAKKNVSNVTRGIVLDEITQNEMNAARLTPRVILHDLLYADVRTRIAAGGVGKTTIAIFEAVTLALGRDLWGRTPHKQCRTVLVTREDSREILVARMREIIRTMQLTPEDVATVLSSIKIVDASVVSFRLSAVSDDVVVPHTLNLDWIVEALADWKPDWIIFDPLISFGVGESRVNDAEQGLIEAFRVLRNRLDCCIEGIHHSGKANAREKNLDQYAGRGGSALSDGSRMVVVLQPLNAEEWQSATGTTLGFQETGLVMALAKLSYAGQQDPIFIRRDGYNFEMTTVTRRSPDQVAKSIEEQVCQFITYEYSQGRKYSSQDLDNSKDRLNLSRQKMRQAITALKVSGRVIYVEVKGKSGSHYEPVTLAC